MKNTQIVQKSPTVQTPAPETIENTKRISAINLLTQYPWLLLGGVLVVFLSSAAVALYSLGYVGRVETASEDTTAVQEFELESAATAYAQTASASSNPLPLWMIAAIALSCASGCLVIFRWLNHPIKKPKIQRNIRRYQSRSTPRPFPKLEPPPTKNLPVYVPRSARKTFTMPDEKKPVVTVLPPEENLNQDEESLAKTLDLRKQTSLSTLLRK
ncbi:hypothetical protein ACF3DV_20495 [Chlorogloeopsis fritschii PCC 9212]|uniref:Transmembrane protein n=1 Tax=Chlorogloeopsis fritschii PCC 6912 TaxID=211165 RepID=A0A433NNA5_CHLFR|nr:hypothetical protein [Chlorogloeopsis fritschii]MBF2004041.1 hypothetical protein [Chlorogloeopsis fritschii C42_A2020_084]RUR84683.1 hypothetical protein PCC6912_15780 [Chlorogloeopsis fritschii PCC 6912]